MLLTWRTGRAASRGSNSSVLDYTRALKGNWKAVERNVL